MRKPENMEGYVSRDQAIHFLRAAADNVSRRDPGDRVKVSIQFSFWNDKWADAPMDQSSAEVTGITAQTGRKCKKS